MVTSTDDDFALRVAQWPRIARANAVGLRGSIDNAVLVLEGDIDGMSIALQGVVTNADEIDAVVEVTTKVIPIKEEDCVDIKRDSPGPKTDTRKIALRVLGSVIKGRLTLVGDVEDMFVVLRGRVGAGGECSVTAEVTLASERSRDGFSAERAFSRQRDFFRAIERRHHRAPSSDDAAGQARRK
jgi:hypothetical protein